MGNLLVQLMENEVTQNFLNKPETNAYFENVYNYLTNDVFEAIKNYVFENVDSFIVPGDLEATNENISNYAQSVVRSQLHEICTEK